MVAHVPASGMWSTALAQIAELLERRRRQRAEPGPQDKLSLRLRDFEAVPPILVGHEKFPVAAWEPAHNENRLVWLKHRRAPVLAPPTGFTDEQRPRDNECLTLSETRAPKMHDNTKDEYYSKHADKRLYVPESP